MPDPTPDTPAAHYWYAAARQRASAFAVMVALAAAFTLGWALGVAMTVLAGHA